MTRRFVMPRPFLCHAPRKRGQPATDGRAIIDAFVFTGSPACAGDDTEEQMARKKLQLGQPARIPASPQDAVLDRVPNPHTDTNYLARFTAPEFTALCPITGQPDFAHLVIDYVPHRRLVESKSLKLFLGSFRNHGAFHEDCTVMIGKRIAAEIKPKWLKIGGYWYPRGGIP